MKLTTPVSFSFCLFFFCLSSISYFESTTSYVILLSPSTFALSRPLPHRVCRRCLAILSSFPFFFEHSFLELFICPLASRCRAFLSCSPRLVCFYNKSRRPYFSSLLSLASFFLLLESCCNPRTCFFIQLSPPSSSLSSPPTPSHIVGCQQINLWTRLPFLLYLHVAQLRLYESPCPPLVWQLSFMFSSWHPPCHKRPAVLSSTGSLVLVVFFPPFLSPRFIYCAIPRAFDFFLVLHCPPRRINTLFKNLRFLPLGYSHRCGTKFIVPFPSPFPIFVFRIPQWR